MLSKIKQFLSKDYLIVLTLIVVSDDTVLFGTNSNSLFIYAKYAILFLLMLYLCTTNKNNNRASLNLCLSMCACVFISSLFNSDIRLGLVYKCTILLLSCLVTRYIDIKKFSNIFLDIIYIIAVVSIVCTLALMLVPSIFSFAPEIVNSGENTFSNLILYVFPTDLDKVRNYGIFREPGVFQMYISIALIFLIYYSNEFSLKKFVVLILSIILTFSTTGYIALFAIICLYFINNRTKYTISSKNKLLVIIFMLVGIAYVTTKTDLLSSEGMVFDKLSNTERHTTLARMSSVTSNIKMWEESPLLGVGLQKAEDLFPILSLKDYGFASQHNTNTFLAELATFGLFYFLLFFFGIIFISKYIGLKTTERCLIFTVLLILSIGEKLTFSPFFFLMVFYGYQLRYLSRNTLKFKTTNNR